MSKLVINIKWNGPTKLQKAGFAARTVLNGKEIKTPNTKDPSQAFESIRILLGQKSVDLWNVMFEIHNSPK